MPSPTSTRSIMTMMHASRPFMSPVLGWPLHVQEPRRRHPHDLGYVLEVGEVPLALNGTLDDAAQVIGDLVAGARRGHPIAARR